MHVNVTRLTHIVCASVQSGMTAAEFAAVFLSSMPAGFVVAITVHALVVQIHVLVITNPAPF